MNRNRTTQELEKRKALLIERTKALEDLDFYDGNKILVELGNKEIENIDNILHIRKVNNEKD